MACKYDFVHRFPIPGLRTPNSPAGLPINSTGLRRKMECRVDLDREDVQPNVHICVVRRNQTRPQMMSPLPHNEPHPRTEAHS